MEYAGFPALWGMGASVALVLGTLALARERSPAGITMASTSLLVLSASVAHLYPFSQRLVLFLVPFTYLLVARGLQSLASKRLAVLAVVPTTLLLLPSLRELPDLASKPWVHEEVRPLLLLLEERRAETDGVYVYYGAEPAVRYYERLLDLDTRDWHFGIGSRGAPDGYRADLRQLRSAPRIWFLFSHVWEDEGDLFFSLIRGRVIESYPLPGAQLVLYEFAARVRERGKRRRPS